VVSHKGAEETVIIAAQASTHETGEKLDARAAWKPAVAQHVVQAEDGRERSSCEGVGARVFVRHQCQR